jgi:hypothetical protein
VRRAAAILFTSIAAASLLAFLALLLGWAGSRGFRHEGPGRYVGIYVDRGMLEFAIYDRAPKVGDRFGVSQSWSRGGITVRRKPGISPPNNSVEGQVPLAYVLAVLAVLPAAWVLWWRSHRARKRWVLEGRCLRCGYDLRESEERCPECGTAILSTA